MEIKIIRKIKKAINDIIGKASSTLLLNFISSD